MTTLVILGASATALAVVRSGHDAGLRTIVLDTERSDAAHSRYAEFQPLRSDHPAEVLETLLTLSLDSPAALLAESDVWLRFLHQHRDRLTERFQILHADEASLGLCLDKEAFHDWCDRNAIPTPRRYNVADSAEAIPFPVVVRPRITCHHRSREVPKAVEVRSPDELAAVLERFRRAAVEPVIAESLLRSSIRCYSVGLARRRDGEIESLVAERVRPAPRHCAAGTYVALAPQKRVQELAETIARRLDLYGLAEIEILHDDRTDELFAIEVNPRPWLQFALADRSGHHLLAFLLGRSTRTPRRRRERGVAWIDIPADLHCCFSRKKGALWNGDVTLAGYLASMLQLHQHPRLSWRDPRPIIESVKAFWSSWARRSK